MPRKRHFCLVVHLQTLARDLVRPAGVVSQAGHRVSDIKVPRDADGLPVVETLELGELLRVALDEVRELVDEAGALGAGDLFAPGGVERRPGGFDCDVNVGGRCGGDGAE